MRYATSFLLAAVMFFTALAANAATIEVYPGQSIQTAITNAVAGDVVNVNPGDYTGGINVTKAITVQGQPGAKLHATTPGSGQGVTIMSDNCTVTGLYLDSFNVAIGVAGIGGMGGFKNNVTIKNNHSYYSQFHYWIGGTNWLVEGNNFERGRWWNGGGDCDYGRMFGTGHVFRRNYLHGSNLSNTDMAPTSGGDYAHHDGMQYYGNNGEVLKNCTIEENFVTDFMQGMFLCDEKTGSFDNVIIRNNVFWGTTFAIPAGSNNYQGTPSWGVAIGKDVGATNILFANNLLYNCANFLAIRAASTGKWVNNIVVGRNSGTVYSPPASTLAAQVTASNLLFAYGYLGDRAGYLGSDVNLNPMLKDVNNPLGADGIPMTDDDGWRPTASVALLYGPQIGTAPAPTPTPTPDTTAPAITLLGANPMTLTQGTAYAEPGATVTDNVDTGLKATITGSVNTLVVGTYTVTYNAKDAAGNAAVTKTRSVSVVAAPTPPAPTPTPPAMEWQRVRIYDSAGRLIGVRWAQVTVSTTKPQ